MSVTDITPDGSMAPVFLDPTPLPLPAGPLEEQPAADLAEREAAAAELIGLGLSEARARVIVGLPPI